MLQSGLLQFDANGAVYCTDAPTGPIDFNGGTPIERGTGRLCIGGVGTYQYAGFFFETGGRLCDESIQPPIYFLGGLPISRAGKLAVSIGGVATKWVGGIPITSDNRVPVVIGTGPIVPTVPSGFDAGFDSGFGV